MIRIVFVAIWFCLVFPVLGQNQPNPFDLKYRPKGSKTTVLPSPQKKTPQPADIKSPDSLIERPVAPENVPGTKADSTSFQIQEDTSGAPSGINPFEKAGASQDTSLGISSGTKLDTNKTESVNIIPLVRGKHMSKGVQIFFLLFSLLLLMFIVNVERNFVKDLWKVISNENYSSLHLRNQKNTMRQILFMMGYIVFLI